MRSQRFLQYKFSRGKRYDPIAQAIAKDAQQRSYERVKTPYYQFRLTAQKRFDHYYGGLLTYQGQAVLNFDIVLGLGEDRQSENIILLRSVFVFPEYRGNGVCSTVLQICTEIADVTGCCIVAVCNPFSVALTDNPDTQKKWLSEGFLLEYEGDYKGEQARMGRRFRKAGFENWDISETIQNKQRCTPNDTFIYVPKNADADFVEAIKHRFLISA
ncbi:hypothetical protein [Gimesia chilikensis]|uniref:hypothetical protein n=1 Tax=Gimesia chilikensis TaxID=2605989 RepID=UPI003A93F3CC